LDQEVYSVRSSEFCFYKDQLTEFARRLVWKHGEGGPPYDPFKIARALGVVVRLECLQGIEGYADYSNGVYFAVLASQSPIARQRFTLAHELGHVLLMSRAQRGLPISLKRYRGFTTPDTGVRDPVEEALCNAFAAELLVPTDEITDQLRQQRIGPTEVLRLAGIYNVSAHASAKKIVKVVGERRVGVSFWNRIRKDWVSEAWRAGLKLPEAALIKKQESLVAEAMRGRKEISECWQTRPARALAKTHRIEIQVMPIGNGDSAVACLRLREATTNDNLKRQNEAPRALRSAQQLPLFLDYVHRDKRKEPD
jgi:Zn-dependent peptidase ImmA (M78 family)